MATIDIEIASRRYSVACRDGDEEHLRSLAALVDRRAHDAAGALGTLSETRQLLFASLLLADDLNTKGGDGGAGPGQAAPEAGPDPAVADALERLAERVELLAQSLESRASNP
jgi:cell division protein ZapA